MEERGTKSFWAAALLTFFLGGIGIHHFYLGRVGLGILYLLFFWTFVPVAISLIELIVMLFSGEESFNKKYNK